MAFAENYLGRIRAAVSDDEIIAIIASLAEELGFRSGYLIDYGSTPKADIRVLDSNSLRVCWWDYVVAAGSRSRSPALNEMLFKDGLHYMTIDSLVAEDDPVRRYADRVDLQTSAVIPIISDSRLRGLVGYSGERVLSAEQERAVQFVSYTLFAQVRSLHGRDLSSGASNLTPREREVMGLSSEGLTAQEVGDRLGLSPRTVHQHMDNVADKLGTRNRVHTVAEAIRRELL